MNDVTDINAQSREERADELRMCMFRNVENLEDAIRNPENPFYVATALDALLKRAEHLAGVASVAADYSEELNEGAATAVALMAEQEISLARRLVDHWWESVGKPSHKRARDDAAGGAA